MNNCTFIGNLTANAEQKTINSNGQQNTFCTFDIAVNRKTRNGGNETLYISCLKNGENAGLLPYLVKGQKVAVQGRIGVNAYLDKQGQPKASLNLSVYELELIGSKQDNAAANTAQAQAQVPSPFQPSSSIAAAQQKVATIFPQRNEQQPLTSDLPF